MLDIAMTLRHDTLNLVDSGDTTQSLWMLRVAGVHRSCKEIVLNEDGPLLDYREMMTLLLSFEYQPPSQKIGQNDNR